MRAGHAAAILLFCSGAAEPTHRYALGPGSDVSAKVGFFGLASKTATFPRMSGSIALQPGRLDTINLDVTLDATALKAGDSVTQKRLMGKDFFDVARYPTIAFSGRRMVMSGPLTATVDGQITARGVTRPTRLDVTFDQPPSRATGRDPVGFTARTVIDRRDFGMTAYSFIVGKKVAITIKAQMVPT
ncbi:YceI family protein [Novosphingobium sp.]|uniref:YceI family protein n=1 Tax=Novosphingobium sp. TaxID=1874826 RepID=UPI0025F6C178|nr:YceI family protein [Novosphingobium sp.]